MNTFALTPDPSPTSWARGVRLRRRFARLQWARSTSPTGVPERDFELQESTQTPPSPTQWERGREGVRACTERDFELQESAQTPPSPTQWERGREGVRAIVVLVALLLTGCVGSLADGLDGHGVFAAQKLQQPIEGDALQPLVEPRSEPTDTAEPSPTEPVAVALDAPAAAEDFDGLGLSVDLSQAEVTRAEGWAPAEKLGHDEARTAYLLRSAAVDSIVKRHRASTTRFDQVDQLNIMVRQYDSFAEDFMTGASTPQVMPEKASWPLQGVGKLESALATIDVEISRARTARLLREQLVQFEETFHEAVYWSRAEDTYRKTAKLARQSLKVAESGYQSGRGKYFYVLFAQNRVDLLSTQQKSAAERAEAARGQLSALLELEPDALDAVELSAGEDPVLPDRDAVREAVTSQGPELQEMAATTERARLMVRYVERQVLPDLTFGTNTTRTGDIPKRPMDLQFSTMAPFLAELALVESAAQAGFDHAQRAVPAEADVLWAALSDELRRLELASGSESSRASQARNAAADAFRAGDLSFFDLDEALTQVLEVELSIHKYRMDAAVAAARLDAATGAK
ncbi:MAG: hypothetical protein CO108_01770 [Deltaproteobacteria bacterium CG_4_9_14_3_um_filter_63_12]|nr:MAG: hypothetical protein CO108_01770 [Deltaproteobacteria bacterium CG_4_9_14_3_um_filter_63_12]